jgi:anion-transporting  ArsA/GET3 family ATPase
MVELRDLFRNPDATEFCIVTIPTQLAIAESGRLLDSLDTQGIAVNNMVVNQVRCMLLYPYRYVLGHTAVSVIATALHTACRVAVV